MAAPPAALGPSEAFPAGYARVSCGGGATHTHARADAAAPSRLSIQIASDLHLEGVFQHGPPGPEVEALITPSAPYLALCGDICTLTADVLPHYEAWLHKIADKFERVFVLAGNHEFYGVSLKEGHERAAAVCATHPRLTYMRRTEVEVNGVVILGCTLWSHVPYHAKKDVMATLNDYRVIQPSDVAEGAMVSPVARAHKVFAELSQEHEDDLAWLCARIQAATRKRQPVVVLTHHAPTPRGSSAPQHGSAVFNLVNHAFTTNLEHLFATYGCACDMPANLLEAVPAGDNLSEAGARSAAPDPRLTYNSTVLAWAFGHTHFNSARYFHGTLVVANQLGYELWGMQGAEGAAAYSRSLVVSV